MECVRVRGFFFLPLLWELWALTAFELWGCLGVVPQTLTAGNGDVFLQLFIICENWSSRRNVAEALFLWAHSY